MAIKGKREQVRKLGKWNSMQSDPALTQDLVEQVEQVAGDKYFWLRNQL